MEVESSVADASLSVQKHLLNEDKKLPHTTGFPVYGAAFL
jgi:hypothetical protein